MEQEPVLILTRCDELFSELKIPYFLVGSFASGIRSEFRATNDIDIVCNINMEKGRKLSQVIKGEFVCDDEVIEDSIKNKKSFNLIHEESITKIDIFTKVTELEELEFSRASRVQIPKNQGSLVVATTEYNIIAKLRWFVSGGRVSELQKRDITSLIEVNRSTLDNDYLQEWAKKLGLTEELSQFMKNNE